MKERPMLFKGEMVRALLSGAKTQTRRVMKPQPAFAPHMISVDGDVTAMWREGFGNATQKSPYGNPGDRLWVREAFCISPIFDSCVYRADDEALTRIIGPAEDSCFRWKPSIHMPRELSRITLEITDVRVERLQEISSGDAKAEGIYDRLFYPCDGYPLSIGYTRHGPEVERALMHTTPIEPFEELWESINGEGSWDANPWVWVISFKPLPPCEEA